MADNNTTTNQQKDQQNWAVVVAAIATARAATLTATRRRGDNATAMVMESYHQRGAGCGLSPKQMSMISKLVAERSEAKDATDHACADKIFDSLLRENSININNRVGKWALVHEEYAFNPNVPSFVPNKDVLEAG